jgi:sulfur carrier protein ThiS
VRVTVKLIGPFIHAAGFSEKSIEVPHGTTAEDLAELVDIDKARPRIITRNGRAVTSADMVEEGDRVVISPLYSGG